MEITTKGFGRVVIKRRVKKPKELKKGGIYFPKEIIKQMRIRSQSVFRPGMKDIEVVYALSGRGSVVEELYEFTTSDILSSSTDTSARVDINNMVREVLGEEGKAPELLIIIHTHPGGITSPSKEDKKFFKFADRYIKQYLPETKVLYGIHAISGGDEVKEKKKPEKINMNTIRWSGITYGHEFSLYTSESKPMEILIEDG